MQHFSYNYTVPVALIKVAFYSSFKINGSLYFIVLSRYSSIIVWHTIILLFEVT